MYMKKHLACVTMGEVYYLDDRPVEDHMYAVADPGFSKWGGAVLSQMGGRTSCFQVKSA